MERDPLERDGLMNSSDETAHLVGRADSDRISQGDLLRAHCIELPDQRDHRLDGDFPLVGASADRADVAAQAGTGGEDLLGDRREAFQVLRHAPVLVLPVMRLAGRHEEGGVIQPRSLEAFEATGIRHQG